MKTNVLVLASIFVVFLLTTLNFVISYLYLLIIFNMGYYD